MFEYEPKILFISGKLYEVLYSGSCINPGGYVLVSRTQGEGARYTSLATSIILNTIYWYNDLGSNMQLNYNSTNYNYIAFEY